MEWLNYHHLLYFWLTAREGSVTRASAELRLAQSTVSAQLKHLEAALGEPLFERQGRQLVLTEVGSLVYQYADEIFSLGREMLDSVKLRSNRRPTRFRVGITDQMPKIIAYRLLQPALNTLPHIRLVCVEGKAETLFAELAVHRLDVVLADRPIGPNHSVRAYNHLLGECGISFFATSTLAKSLTGRFPRCLDGAQMLLPGETTALRRDLDSWLEGNSLRPLVIGEFEDSALLKSFGQAGLGVFLGPSAIEGEICRQYDVKVVGRVDRLRENFYAVSVERRLKHPAVVAISESARVSLFA